MNLAAHQRNFIAEIAADDDAPTCASTGMDIYRNAYRARLVDALSAGFERTRRCVGEHAFASAAAHFVLTNPPGSWTLDAYGAGFPAALETLFADDPEVAELAWLEWHMQQAFAAPDLPELTPQGLAEAGLQEHHWEIARFTMAAGFTAREVRHDCAALWHAHSADKISGLAVSAIESSALVVWRRGFSPHFRVLDCDEFAALGQLAAGASFGETATLIGDRDLARFGEWFAGWLREGLFSAVSLPA